MATVDRLADGKKKVEFKNSSIKYDIWMYFFQDVHQREPAEEADLGVRGGPEPVAAAGRHLEGTHPTAHHRRALLRAPSQGIAATHCVMEFPELPTIKGAGNTYVLSR